MKYIITLVLTLIILLVGAQTNPLRINKDINLNKDSINLITTLNEFLLAAQKPNEENNYVFIDEKIETFIELDELKGIEKSEKFNDKYFYKPYLTNVTSYTKNSYLVQISYIGINDNTAYLKASFEFVAHQYNNTFTFSSPLINKTKNWKMLKSGSHVFHYQNEINKEKVKEYIKLTNTFDAKLKIPNNITDYYLCDNLTELNKLLGVMYKLDYNGIKEGISTFDFENRKLVLYGNGDTTFNEFDPHDLFHDRLSFVIPRNKVNRSVDEGCAYLYGGSWGFTWEEIFKAFKEQIANNKNIDWMAIKENDITFKTGEFFNFSDYIVNALLVEKIEKEKGFAGVWELLTIGPAEKGNEKYYQTLEKLIGISKVNYNKKIWELINNKK